MKNAIFACFEIPEKEFIFIFINRFIGQNNSDNSVKANFYIKFSLKDDNREMIVDRYSLSCVYIYILFIINIIIVVCCFIE